MSIKKSLAILFFLSMLTACTISFSNVSTHGTATDLIDEDQKSDADVDVSPDVNLPTYL